MDYQKIEAKWQDIWNKEKVQVIFLLSIPKHLYKLWENIFKSI